MVSVNVSISLFQRWFTTREVFITAKFAKKEFITLCEMWGPHARALGATSAPRRPFRQAHRRQSEQLTVATTRSGYNLSQSVVRSWSASAGEHRRGLLLLLMMMMTSGQPGQQAVRSGGGAHLSLY